MTTANYYRVVVYINGVRFFPISVSVTAARNQFLYFTVDVPAVPEWAILPPRSHAAVFFVDPVTLTWRFLCEGEYIARTRSKDAAGNRTRALTFRSLHGTMETAQYISLGSVIEGGAEGALNMVANGRVLAAGTDSNANIALANINVLIQSLKADSSRVSAIFTELVKNILLQLPVEAFYSAARKLLTKMFTLADDDINRAIDVEFFKELTTDGINSRSLSAGQTLLSLLQKYESICMYQHTQVLAPPIYAQDNGVRIIPELWFAPYLYNTIPPACNVVFQDQIQQMSDSENFALTPTRVVLRPDAANFGPRLPAFVMCNTTQGALVTQELARLTSAGSSGSTMSLAATHGLLNKDELLRGVNIEYVPYSLETVAASAAQLTPSQGANDFNGLSYYLQQLARHHYEISRGAARPAQLQCTFLPYLIPGVTCLVEDYSGPIYGFVESVTHVLPSTGMPSTSVMLSHVHEVYQIRGKNRSPAFPNWYSKRFRGPGIGGVGYSKPTWELLFGAAPMVPPEVISNAVQASGVSVETRDAYDAPDTVNLDALASQVVSTPEYDKTGRFLAFSTGTKAEELRKNADPAMAMNEFNFRPGVTLSQYAAFHDLDVSAESDVGLSEPPEQLFSEPGDQLLFGIPAELQFVPQGNGQSPQPVPDGLRFGPYVLARDAQGRTLDDLRQRAALTISNAIARRITRS